MIHHLIKEKDQKEMCPYCGVNLCEKSWNSEFHLEIHYKTLRCQCGKKVRRKLNIISSGHDYSKSNKEKKSIDGIIREIKGAEEIKKS